MVRLRILAILEEQGHTKYWHYKRMDMMSYRNFQKIVDNETSSIRFETLDKLSRILNVPIGELFEQTEEMSDNEKKLNRPPKNNALHSVLFFLLKPIPFIYPALRV